jgi:hypothetical protein
MLRLHLIKMGLILKWLRFAPNKKQDSPNEKYQFS